MRIEKEMFARWKKYTDLLLAEHNMRAEDIVSPRVAWDIAFKLDFWKEAYHVGCNDNHIETALKRIFPRAWGK